MSYFKTINILIAVLATHSGRDKLAKFLHYGTRIANWYYTKLNKLEMASKMESMRLSVGNSRRIGRFLSFINSVPGVVDVITNPEEKGYIKFLQMVAHIMDILYFISDNLTWFAKFDVYKLSPKANYYWEEIIGSWSWFIAMIIYVYFDVRTHLGLKAQLKNEHNKDEKKKIAKAIQANHLNIIKNLCDLQIAIYFCFPNSSYKSPIVGIFGVVNAIIGFYQIWNAKRKMIS